MSKIVNKEEVVNYYDSDSEKNLTGKILVMDFFAEWCGPCKSLMPILDSVQSELPEVEIIKINVDENPILTNKLNIRNIPTLIVLSKDSIKTTLTGMQSKDTLKQHISKC